MNVIARWWRAWRAPHTPKPSCGCVGCGARYADVHTPPEPPRWPRGEGYCWRCVDDLGATGYTVLPGRERKTTDAAAAPEGAPA